VTLLSFSELTPVLEECKSRAKLQSGENAGGRESRVSRRLANSREFGKPFEGKSKKGKTCSLLKRESGATANQSREVMKATFRLRMRDQNADKMRRYQKK